MTDRLLREADVLAVLEPRIRTLEAAEAGARHPDTLAEVRRLVSELKLARDAIRSLPPAPAGDVQRLRAELEWYGKCAEGLADKTCPLEIQETLREMLEQDGGKRARTATQEGDGG